MGMDPFAEAVVLAVDIGRMANSLRFEVVVEDDAKLHVVRKILRGRRIYFSGDLASVWRWLVEQEKTQQGA